MHVSVVLAAALAVRVLGLLVLAPRVRGREDAGALLGAARALVEGGELLPRWDGAWPSLHTMLVAVGLDGTGEPWPGVYLLQIGLDVLTCALVIAIAVRIVGKRAGVAAGWIYALLPSAVFHSATLVRSEAVVGLLLALSLWLFLRVVDGLRAGRGSVAGIAWGLALGVGVVAREWMLVLVAVLGAVLLLEGSIARRLRLRGLALAAVAGACLVLPMALHHHQHRGDAAPPAGGQVVLAHHTAIVAPEGARPSVPPRTGLAHLTQLAPGGPGGGGVRSRIVEHALQVISGAGLLLLLVFAAAGLAAGAGGLGRGTGCEPGRSPARRAVLLLTVALVLCAVVWPTHACPGMVLPPVLASFAGIGWCAMCGDSGFRRRERNHARRWASAILLLLGPLMLVWPVPSLL